MNDCKWYSYVWKMRTAPQIGDRVWAPGEFGGGWAVVVGMGSPRDLVGFDAKEITRAATAQEVAKAVAKFEADRNAWLDMMRKAAGLKSSTRRRRVPSGYPDIPPAQGDAAPDVANAYGSAWWRAYKAARDDEERKRFKELGHRWYAIRDRGTGKRRSNSITQAAAALVTAVPKLKPAPPVQQPTPAVWAPDPSGVHELRWWDGSRWTEHVVDVGVQSVDPLLG